jgi:hypothetical protein
MAHFWILFRPGLGYYCADGEARKAAVFLRSDFHREIESISLQQPQTHHRLAEFVGGVSVSKPA